MVGREASGHSPAEPSGAAGEKKRLPPLKKREDLLVTLLSTAVSMGYAAVYFNGKQLEGTHGQKGKIMTKLRDQLSMDDRFGDRVPRGDVLDAWLDKAVADRLQRGPDRECGGEGGENGDAEGACTESALQTEVDKYIHAAKQAIRKTSSEKRAKELEEQLGEVSALALCARALVSSTTHICRISPRKSWEARGTRVWMARPRRCRMSWMSIVRQSSRNPKHGCWRLQHD